MSKRIFSKGEIAALLKSRRVAGCTPKAITYRPDFKIAAVRQYREEGIPAKDIFRKAGFSGLVDDLISQSAGQSHRQRSIEP